MTRFKRRLARLEAAAVAATSQGEELEPWAAQRWDAYFDAHSAAHAGRGPQPEIPTAPPGSDGAAWRGRMVNSYLIGVWARSGAIDTWVRTGSPPLVYPAWVTADDRQQFEAFREDVRRADQLLQAAGTDPMVGPARAPS